ncbi:hypothetical protein F5X99DRAFT_169933 [Biscogniauxia marginata]|nr:hypothetical protein F5X99DRAFT_169933 [Biscogniauxia marginata]
MATLNLYLALLFSTCVAQNNDTQCPVEIPGYSHHGNCDLLCRSATWTDIIAFFLGNYVAHAATVIGLPGQSSLTSIVNVMMALCFPGSGVIRGIRAISSRAVLAPTDLQMAARAGAICAIVRDDECQDDNDASPNHREVKDSAKTQTRQPGGTLMMDEEIEKGMEGKEQGTGETAASVSGSVYRITSLSEMEEGQTRLSSIARRCKKKSEAQNLPPSFATTKIHGIYHLPPGYYFVVLPPDSVFENEFVPSESFTSKLRAFFSSSRQTSTRPLSTISCDYSIIKIVISLGQLLFAISTLYQSRGDQIATFGYAAFGLTVTPYAWMSFVNLLGNLMCPQYPTMYFVSSPTLIKLKGQLKEQETEAEYPLEGAVGSIGQATDDALLRRFKTAKSTSSRGILRKRRLDKNSKIAGQLLDSGTSAQRQVMFLMVLFGFITAPIAIIGGFSGFEPGESSFYQQVWTMLWLGCGISLGPTCYMIVQTIIEPRPILHDYSATGKQSWLIWIYFVDILGLMFADFPFLDNLLRVLKSDIYDKMTLGLTVASYMVPTIGGFVVVGQMISQYGTCSKISA